jgi:hypothetical protein
MSDLRPELHIRSEAVTNGQSQPTARLLLLVRLTSYCCFVYVAGRKFRLFGYSL